MLTRFRDVGNLGCWVWKSIQMLIWYSSVRRALACIRVVLAKEDRGIAIYWVDIFECLRKQYHFAYENLNGSNLEYFKVLRLEVIYKCWPALGLGLGLRLRLRHPYLRGTPSSPYLLHHDRIYLKRPRSLPHCSGNYFWKSTVKPRSSPIFVKVLCWVARPFPLQGSSDQ